MNEAAQGRTPTGRPERRAATTVHGVVIRRSDFRESSRIVACLTRDHGRMVGLAKGAHRADSVFLGKIDFLNEVRATFSADRGGLRLLLRAEAMRERRALREPLRFLAASHLAQLCDFAMPDARPAPDVFDLLVGGLALIERCPPNAIGQVVLGLELRHLEVLGALPDLERCTTCDTPLPDGAFRNEHEPGLVCRAHATLPRLAVGSEVLELLRTLRRTPGRQLPAIAPPVPPRVAAPLLASWFAAATEQRFRLRALLFEHC
ncbi:MAG: DNA repair protein RecO [Planctomycetes bacterium]|nr:DNA repair protein RecO [Planctomycetota bacterium]